MKKLFSKLAVNSVIFLLAVIQSYSQYDISIPEVNVKKTDDLKSLSPYFLILSKENKLEQFPLLSTRADVNIAGVIADVTITQTYKNDGEKPIEAKYVFPASINAAVYQLTMIIGNRIIKAEIYKKEEAKQLYEEAKKEGRTASLLEQERPNVFTMNVANIMPGDSIKVEMKYTELVIPENKVYEFVYPTVVGPRFVNDKLDSNQKNENNYTTTPYTKKDKQSSYDFDINIKLKTGLPVSEVRSFTHDIDLKFLSPNEATVGLQKGQLKSGNKDFILKYSLVGNQIESGLLLHQGKDENYFLMMLQPPKRVTPSKIPPREYVFILDVSGSMMGHPITIGKKLLAKLIRSLNKDDKFNIMLFSGDSEVFRESSVEANLDNLKDALDFIDNKRGGGGTQILEAMSKALSMKRQTNISTSFIILTDGYVSVEAKTYDLIRENLVNANIFTFGIGSSVNRTIIDGMANIGLGESFIVTNKADANKTAERFLEYVRYPIMTNINIDFNGFQAYDVEPKTIPDLMADRPILVYGKYRGDARGIINVSGFTDKILEVEFNTLKFGQFDQSPAIKYLWARNKIQLLDDYAGVSFAKSNEEEVSKLGLKYNLLTQYTSFLAVDYEVRNIDGKLTMVKQPLPLPDGVSESALNNNENRNQKIGSISKIRGIRMSNPLRPSSKGRLSSEFLELDDLNSGVGSNWDEDVQLNPIVEMDFDKKATYKNSDIYKYLEYPTEFLIKQTEQDIIIKVLVNEDGKVNQWDEISGNYFQFYRAAFNAIKQIQFLPAQKDNKAVQTWLEIPVSFKLREYDEILKIGENKYNFHIFKNGFKEANIKHNTISNNKTISIGDNVKLKYQRIDESGKIINDNSNNVLEFTAGISEIEKFIDKASIGMALGSEKILIIPAYLLSNQNRLFKLKRNQELIIKIHILEIE